MALFRHGSVRSALSADSRLSSALSSPVPTVDIPVAWVPPVTDYSTLSGQSGIYPYSTDGHRQEFDTFDVSEHMRSTASQKTIPDAIYVSTTHNPTEGNGVIVSPLSSPSSSQSFALDPGSLLYREPPAPTLDNELRLDSDESSSQFYSLPGSFETAHERPQSPRSNASAPDLSTRVECSTSPPAVERIPEPGVNGLADGSFRVEPTVDLSASLRSPGSSLHSLPNVGVQVPELGFEESQRSKTFNGVSKSDGIVHPPVISDDEGVATSVASALPPFAKMEESEFSRRIEDHSPLDPPSTVVGGPGSLDPIHEEQEESNASDGLSNEAGPPKTSRKREPPHRSVHVY